MSSLAVWDKRSTMNRSMRPALLASIAARAFDVGPPAVNGPRTPTNSQWAGSAQLSDTIASLVGQLQQAYSADDMLKRAPDSAAMLEYWDLSDALVEGHKAVLACGEKWFPKFTDEDGPEYETRKRFTKYTNVFGDIVESLASKPFEEEITLADGTSADIEAFCENVDGSGNNITQFASATFYNAIASAIDWIFVDYSKPDASIRSVADAKAIGLQPYWSHVLGRNVLQADTKVIAGKETLTYIRIFEPASGVTPDRVRIFQRDDASGTVIWALYERQEQPREDGKTYFILIDNGPVTINRIPLVPFATGRRDGRTFKFHPAMRGAADLQIQLFQDESALKWAKTLTAYPMLGANGIKPDMGADGKTPKKLAVGPGRVLYGPRDGQGNHGTWAYVEPAATSLTFLAGDIKETIAQLRELGRQPLTAQSGNITVITAAVAAGKAKSAVQAWAYALKDALENAMVLTTLWTNTKEAVSVKVFTEFDTATDSIDELPALNAAEAAGTISKQTVRAEFARRGVLGSEWTEDEEKKRLLAETPADPNDALDDGNPGAGPANPRKKP